MDHPGDRQRASLRFLGPRPIQHLALWSAAIAASFTVWFWPIGGLSPTAGLDSSWVAGLAMAAVRHLQFGPQILFTYGPLGYLAHPVLYYTRTGVPAVAFVIIAEAAAIWVLARALLRVMHPLLALAVLWGISALCLRYLAEVDNTELLAAVLAVQALEWLYRAASPRRERLELVALTAASTALLLVKFSAGLDALAAVAIAALFRCGALLAERRRDVPAAFLTAACGAGTVVLGLPALWVFSHQHLGNLVSYLHGSLQLASGYASAMSIEDPHAGLKYVLTIVFGAAVVVAAIWVGRARSTSATRYGCAAVLVAVGFGFFKEAFVRQDAHQILFFAGVAVLIGALLPHARIWQALALALACVAITAALEHAPARTLFLHDGPSMALHTVRDVASGSQRRAIQSQARAGLQAAYAGQGLTAVQVSLLTGHTVHIDPWEASVIWAYPQIQWDPAPIFQSYAAFTPYLDQLNSTFLTSASAPEFILRQFASIDGRDARWESPDYMVTMACHYSQVSTGAWQVLQRVPDRCGAPAYSGSTRIAFGQTLHVPDPAPGSILVARFQWPPSLADALDTLVVHLPQYYVETSGGHPGRFLPSTAGAWHILSIPSCFDWSPAFIAPTTEPPFRFVEGAPAPAPKRGLIGVQLATIPFSCPSAGASAP